MNYEHFGEAQSGKCPLHDNVENRHEQEVKKAADEAMAKVRVDNPGLSDADLMIQVSDRVKQAENARKERAAASKLSFSKTSKILKCILTLSHRRRCLPILHGRRSTPTTHRS